MAKNCQLVFKEDLIILQKENNFDLFPGVFKNPNLFLACGFGVGLIRPGPGTWGTLIALPIHHVLSLVLNLEALSIFWILMFFVGVLVCRASEKILGELDHSAIVIDEFVAFGLILAFIPNYLYLHLVAFVLFRIFDIFKPFGIGYIDQHVKGGLGVMLDDLLAAGYTLVVMMVLLLFVNFPLSERLVYGFLR